MPSSMLFAQETLFTTHDPAGTAPPEDGRLLPHSIGVTPFRTQ